MMGKFQHIYVANEVLVLAVDVAAGGVIAGKQHPLLPINQHKIQRIHVLIAVVLHRFRPDAVHRQPSANGQLIAVLHLLVDCAVRQGRVVRIHLR